RVDVMMLEMALSLPDPPPTLRALGSGASGWACDTAGGGCLTSFLTTIGSTFVTVTSSSADAALASALFPLADIAAVGFEPGVPALAAVAPALRPGCVSADTSAVWSLLCGVPCIVAPCWGTGVEIGACIPGNVNFTALPWVAIQPISP